MHRATLVLVALVVAPAACRTGEPGAETSSSSTTEAEETTGGPTSTTTADDSGAATSSSSSETEEPPASSTTTASPLTSTSEPDLCGNGIQDPGEECDDGNLLDADFCTASCTLAVCGDGIVQLGVEGCDDGGGDADECPSTCQPAKCGDGFVWAGEEECDDGNFVPGDGCEVDCTPSPPVCGDGVVEGDEECDDGNDAQGDGCDDDCTPSVFILEGFAKNVALSKLKGWSKCYDSSKDPDAYWTGPQVRDNCLGWQPGLVGFLIGCMVAGNETDVVDVMAAGPMPEVGQAMDDPPKFAAGAWWAFSVAYQAPDKSFFGAFSTDNPNVGARVLFAWRQWDDPQITVSAPCGGPNSVGTRQVIYRRWE